MTDIKFTIKEYIYNENYITEAIRFEIECGPVHKLYEADIIESGNIFLEMLDKFNNTMLDKRCDPILLIKLDTTSIFFRRMKDFCDLILCCVDSPFEDTGIHVNINNVENFTNSLIEASKLI